MSTFDFEVYDRRAGRLVKTPEVTVQSKGSLSLNAAAVRLLGEPGAVELLYDRRNNVVGIRAVDPGVAHAYPMRPVAKGATYVISARGFFLYYEIPLGEPIRRDVQLDGDVLVLDLKNPGRVAVSNRNRNKAKNADSNGAGSNGTRPADAVDQDPAVAAAG